MSFYGELSELMLSAGYHSVMNKLNGRHVPATLSKGETKKCKSCQDYPNCKNCYKPLQTACENYKRKKRR